MKKFLSKILSLSVVLSSVFVGMPAGASGVVVTLTPSSSSTSPTDVTIAWTGSAVITAGNTVTVTASGNGNLTFASGTPATVDLDGDAAADGYLTSVGVNSATYYVATSTSLTANSLELSVAFDGNARNYSIAVFVSGIADFGAALFYANGGNLVNVTAAVPATLAFSIRNAADDAYTNSCALGTLTTVSTSTCQYRLRISTNAEGGFTASIQADADLNSNGSATITAATNDGAATAGTESYGISALTGATAGGRNGGGTAYDQPVLESNIAGTTFDTDISPVPTAGAVAMVSYADPFDAGTSPNLTNTTLVEHFANISGGTPAGNYSQVVTYTVTATF